MWIQGDPARAAHAIPDPGGSTDVEMAAAGAEALPLGSRAGGALEIPPDLTRGAGSNGRQGPAEPEPAGLVGLRLLGLLLAFQTRHSGMPRGAEMNTF